MPQRPGPRRAHKLSEEVVDFLEQWLAEDTSLRSSQAGRHPADRLSFLAGSTQHLAFDLDQVSYPLSAGKS